MQNTTEYGMFSCELEPVDDLIKTISNHESNGFIYPELCSLIYSALRYKGKDFIKRAKKTDVIWKEDRFNNVSN